jgi:hypothetical protein
VSSPREPGDVGAPILYSLPFPIIPSPNPFPYAAILSCSPLGTRIQEGRERGRDGEGIREGKEGREVINIIKLKIKKHNLYY